MYSRSGTRKLVTINAAIALVAGAAILTLALTRTAGAETSRATPAPTPATAPPPPSPAATAVRAAAAKPVAKLAHDCTRLFSQRDFAMAARSAYRGERRPGL